MNKYLDALCSHFDMSDRQLNVKLLIRQGLYSTLETISNYINTLYNEGKLIRYFSTFIYRK